MHPFTCCGEAHALNSPTLIATADGWRCPRPECDYRQDWAHSFMADPDAVAALIESDPLRAYIHNGPVVGVEPVRFTPSGRHRHLMDQLWDACSDPGNRSARTADERAAQIWELFEPYVTEACDRGAPCLGSGCSHDRAAAELTRITQDDPGGEL